MRREVALLLVIMNDYLSLDYKLSLLEIEKLAYFLQIVGEPLQLKFKKGEFGPHVDNLNDVLKRLDGYYISRDAEIYLIKDVANQARKFLGNDMEAFEQLEKVRGGIQGFETPYGLELLSTVHWVANNNPEIKDDVGKIVEEVHNWNERKMKIMKVPHIKKAWEHLQRVI